MAVEAKRGCGYRKVGGLYLVGSGLGLNCDRLPIPLEVCPCCGAGIKQTRGFTWVDIAGLVGGDHVLIPEVSGTMIFDKDDGKEVPAAIYQKRHKQACACPGFCPLCHNVAKLGKGGLLWIGTQFYSTIEAFEMEARTLGISRRIAALPRGFKLGETWLLLAHPRGILKPVDGLTAKYIPAIFRVWKPERLERIYKESDRDNAAVKADIERGITPVFVPDGDRDHQGSVYEADDETGAESGAENGQSTPPLFPDGPNN